MRYLRHGQGTPDSTTAARPIFCAPYSAAGGDVRVTNIIACALAVLLQVESSGGVDLRPGDGGRAIGPYQMHACAVVEATRIEAIYARREHRPARTWTDLDRDSLAESAAMCEVSGSVLRARACWASGRSSSPNSPLIATPLDPSRSPSP